MPVQKENVIQENASINEAIQTIEESKENETVSIPKSVLDNILSNMNEMKAQITRMSSEPKKEKVEVITNSIIIYKTYLVDEQTALRSDWKRSPQIPSSNIQSYIEKLKKDFIAEHYESHINEFLDMLSETKKHIPTNDDDKLKRFIEFYWKE